MKGLFAVATVAVMTLTPMKTLAQSTSEQVEALGRLAFRGLVALNRTDQVNSFSPSSNSELHSVLLDQDGRTIFLVLSLDWEVRGSMTLSILNQCNPEWLNEDDLTNPVRFFLPLGEVRDNFDPDEETPINDRYLSGACSPPISVVDDEFSTQVRTSFKVGRTNLFGTYLVQIARDEGGFPTSILLTKGSAQRSSHD